VDADHISAEIRNGVLQVKLPKTPQARPRKIEVQGVH
jgi:HSP20 family molecular chaperone IbpA